MDQNQATRGDLADEFRSLGKNLAAALQAAWESPERKRMQQEIEAGLVDLVSTLKQETATFRESPTGQRIRTDLEDFRQRVRSGEAESAARSELLGVLRTINAELEKASRAWSPESREKSTSAGPEQEK